MNRILVTADEMVGSGRVTLTGRRAEHLKTVLRAVPGQVVRIGVIDGACGEAEVLSCAGGRVELACRLDRPPPPPPRVSLLLALPRPKVMKRLWAPLASLGIRRLALTNAEKVERCYFDSHVLDPAWYRDELIEGLEQSGDTRLPEVVVRRRLKPFLEDELEAWYPSGCRLVCHPRGGDTIRRCVPPAAHEILLAVGPEGGWTPYELDLLAAHGFVRAHGGARVLRTDVAVIALVTLAHDALPVEVWDAEVCS